MGQEQKDAPVVLVTGASTGIGNLTAKALAAAGHVVYASMRDPSGRNAAHAQELLEATQRAGSVRIVELDVQSQASADRAVATVVGDTGHLDVVVHNAGHLYVGYAEAFTAEDIAHLFDINVLGAQRVNRAVLPHMRHAAPAPCSTPAARHLRAYRRSLARTWPPSSRLTRWR
jgi:NAD(P)-dependent dehydrogenase (short-subunit alcohol dehydrogenase family)